MHLLTDIILNIEYHNSIKKKIIISFAEVICSIFEIEPHSLWAITIYNSLSRYFLLNITTQ